jgi:hypothetical protein
VRFPRNAPGFPDEPIIQKAVRRTLEKFKRPLHAVPDHTLLTGGIRRYWVTGDGFMLQSLRALGGALGPQEFDQAGVRGLDVAMDNPLLMRVLDGLADLNEQLEPLFHGQARLIAKIGDPDAADQFHHEIGAAGDRTRGQFIVSCLLTPGFRLLTGSHHTGIQDFGDMWMIHHGQRVTLHFEARLSILGTPIQPKKAALWTLELHRQHGYPLPSHRPQFAEAGEKETAAMPKADETIESYAG